MDDYILFKNLDGKYLTLKDCIEENKKGSRNSRGRETGRREKRRRTGRREGDGKDNIYLCIRSKYSRASTSICSKKQGMDAVILTHNIDTAFITHVEQKHEDVKFQRIDADLTEELQRRWQQI